MSSRVFGSLYRSYVPYPQYWNGEFEPRQHLGCLPFNLKRFICAPGSWWIVSFCEAPSFHHKLGPKALERKCKNKQAAFRAQAFKANALLSGLRSAKPCCTQRSPALVDLSQGGETGPKRWAGEGVAAAFFEQWSPPQWVSKCSLWRSHCPPTFLGCSSSKIQDSDSSWSELVFLRSDLEHLCFVSQLLAQQVRV